MRETYLDWDKERMLAHSWRLEQAILKAFWTDLHIDLPNGDWCPRSVCMDSLQSSAVEISLETDR